MRSVVRQGQGRAVEGEDGDFRDLVGLDPLTAAFRDHLDCGFRNFQGLGELHTRSHFVALLRHLDRVKLGGLAGGLAGGLGRGGLAAAASGQQQQSGEKNC